MQTTYWLLEVKWTNGCNYSGTIWHPLKSANRQWQEELGVKLIFHMFRGRPCDNHLPPSDTGDFFFFRAGKKSWTFGLAARRQVSRPDLEICCAEYSAVLQDDASVGTSPSFRQSGNMANSKRCRSDLDGRKRILCILSLCASAKMDSRS